MAEENDFESKPADAMAVASYLGPLCLAPLLTKEEDAFVRFHMKQGMILFVVELAVWLIFHLLFAVLGWVSPPGLVLTVFSLLQCLVYFGIVVLIYIGIRNVLDEKMHELPFVGKFAARIPIS